MARARVAIYVQPRASKTELAGMHDGCVKIRLAAPPVDGEANDALVEFIARRIGMPKRNVRIVSGQAARRKVVEVEGADDQQVRSALGMT
jgi:uncharacterized protein (TIGR00251 family)